MLTGLACTPPQTEDAAPDSQVPIGHEAILDDSGRTVAVVSGKTVYLSGILPADASAPVADQAVSAMDRLGQALDMAELDHSHVVSCHVHLSDMDDYADMNSVYGSYFEEGSYPARTTLEVSGLEGGAGLLLTCIAFSDASEIEVVRPPATEIPPAMGPYSPAVRAGGTVYLSGQGGRDPATGEIAASAGGQAGQTLRTIGKILEAAGLSYANTVLAQSYLPPASSAEAVDDAFAGIFDPGGAPSRANVALSRLPGDIAVEITFVAVEDDFSSPVSLSEGVAYSSATPGRGDTLAEQVSDALESQESTLQLALMDLSNIVRLTAYLESIDDLGEFRTALSETLPREMPALTVVEAGNPAATRVSLEAIAAK